MIKREPYDLALALGLLALLLGYLTLVWTGFYGPFLFDDEPNLQNLRVLAGDASNIGAYLAEFNGNPGRPLAALSFLINDNAWPSDPFTFKFTNVLIHLLNGVLLLGLLRQLQAVNVALPQSPLWPLLAMTAWLFHPLLLSSQMLVVQRMTLLSAFFCLSGLWAYTAILQRSRHWQGALLAICVLALCTLLAVLCKENGALLTLFALCLNMTLLHTLQRQYSVATRQLLFWSCALPALALVLYIGYTATRPDAFINREFNAIERLMTQCHVLADYVRQMFMPRLSGSGIFFDDYPITRHLFASASTAALAASWLAILAWALLQRRRYPILAFAILWFFAGHLLESSVMNLELYFEHRNYLPLIGPMLLLSTLVFKNGKVRPAWLALFTLWLALLAGITGQQARVWGDRALLANIWAMERPNSLRASQEFINYQTSIGNYQVALDFSQKRANQANRYVDFQLSALLNVCLNRDVRGEGQEYLKALASIPNANFTNSAMVLTQQLRHAVQTNACPGILSEQDWLALTNAFLAHHKYQRVAGAFIHYQRALLFKHKLNLDGTMQEMELAYEHSPNIEMSQYIAEALLSAGLIDEAEQWLNKGLLLRKPWLKEHLGVSRQRSLAMLAAINAHKSELAASNAGSPR
jgi:tetratricopeptide (TPR) repeat protein